MKLSLLVSVGNAAGKVIPIAGPQFLIGRDPGCHLRPASPIISKRHCALLLRGNKAYIKDFESTNGTLVNDQRITGEHELKDQDALKIGPLEFVVKIEDVQSVPVDKPTPTPAANEGDDDAVAAMLLAMQDNGSGTPGGLDAVPEGSTVLDMPAVNVTAQDPNAPMAALSKGKKPEKPAPTMNTQTAAEAILQKYSRRNRRTT